MKTYSMSLRSVLAVKKREFFWMLRQAERLEAQESRRTLELLLSVNSAESVEAAFKALDEDLGVVVEWGKFIPPAFDLANEEGLDPEFDRSGLQALRNKNRVSG